MWCASSSARLAVSVADACLQAFLTCAAALCTRRMACTTRWVAAFPTSLLAGGGRSPATSLRIASAAYGPALAPGACPSARSACFTIAHAPRFPLPPRVSPFRTWNTPNFNFQGSSLMVYMGRNLISDGIWTGNCLSPGCRAVELSRLRRGAVEALSRSFWCAFVLVCVCSGVRERESPRRPQERKSDLPPARNDVPRAVLSLYRLVYGDPRYV